MSDNQITNQKQNTFEYQKHLQRITEYRLNSIQGK